MESLESKRYVGISSRLSTLSGRNYLAYPPVNIYLKKTSKPIRAFQILYQTIMQAIMFSNTGNIGHKG